jgi:hypothetical protein
MRTRLSNLVPRPRFLSPRCPAALGALLLLVTSSTASAQIVLAGFSFDTNAGPDRVVPMPGSQPEFDGQLTGCAFASTIPGLSLDESMKAVMLSNTVLNCVRGKAVFRLDFEDNSIINLPGPDVMVFELGDAETFELRVWFADTAAWSNPLNFVGTSTGFAVACPSPNTIHARAIDLSDFGVLPDAKVHRLLFDNKGNAGSATGADLMQVMAIHSSSPVLQSTRLSSFQYGVAGSANAAYAGTADTYLYNGAPGLNFSTEESTWVDSSPYGTTLIRFDSIVGTAVGQIPPGATILSASLHLATGGGDSDSNNTHSVHRLLQPFDVGTITYANGFGGNGIAADGVESSILPDGSIGPMGDNATQAVNVTALVQDWVNGVTNHGVALRPGGSNGLGLHTSEATIATLRPALSVVFEHHPWTNLGGSLAGTNGAPQLAASGRLADGKPILLAVSNGVPSGTAIFVLGTSVLNAPFMGGLFVPTPQVVVPGLPLDGAGALVVPGTWPSGVPTGIDIVIQFWIPDAGGPLGFAATNACKAVTE